MLTETIRFFFLAYQSPLRRIIVLAIATVLGITAVSLAMPIFAAAILAIFTNYPLATPFMSGMASAAMFIDPIRTLKNTFKFISTYIKCAFNSGYILGEAASNGLINGNEKNKNLDINPCQTVYSEPLIAQVIPAYEKIKNIPQGTPLDQNSIPNYKIRPN